MVSLVVLASCPNASGYEANSGCEETSGGVREDNR